MVHPLSIKKILHELEISKDEFYRALPVLKDEGVKLHLKKSSVGFVNNYFGCWFEAFVGKYGHTTRV